MTVKPDGAADEGPKAFDPRAEAGTPEVARIEAFSDAVFAFSLTLLVVATEVPKNFDGLMKTLCGFLPFAACFALLSWLWWSHHRYFRRFGSADRVTVILNLFLLFFLLFYVYPLKFVANLVLGLGEFGRNAAVPKDGSLWIMIVYGAGFMGISLIFAALYGRARHRRTKAGCDPRGAFQATGEEISWYANAGIAFLSCVVAMLPFPQATAWSGFTYFLLGPVQAFLGFRRGRAERLRFGDDEARPGIGLRP